MITAIVSRKITLLVLFVLLSAGVSHAAIVTTGLQVYLDANSIGLNNGDPVSAWNSTGPATVNAAQVTGVRQPTYVTNGPNGNAVVRFDGGLVAGGMPEADYMNLGSITAGTAYTAFFVLKVDTEPHAPNQSGLAKLNNYDQDTHYPYSDGNVYDATLATVRKSTGNPTLNLTQYHIYSVESQPGFWRSRFNGTPFFTTNTNTPAVNASGIGNVIGASTVGAQHLDGDFAAILIYNVALNTDQYYETLGALSTQFAITVPEPSSISMLLCGAFALWLVRKK